MVYLGVDLHRKRSHVVALDERGDVLLSRRIDSTREDFRRVFGELEPEPLRVAFEAAYGWSWFAYLARDFAPLDAAALMSLRRFEMAVRLAIRGETSSAFTLRTLEPAAANDIELVALAKATSRERYARPSELVDREPSVPQTPVLEARTSVLTID